MYSILSSIKKLLGIPDEYSQFDIDIIMHINSIFSILTQLGVGPKEGFYIEDEMTEWSDYLSNQTDIELVKSYMHMRVRLLFDPPTSSSVTESINRMISEIEWRLQVMIETKEVEN